MRLFGANALFLSPEYLGKVNPLSTAIVGVSLGVFVMSWNITTFILHSSRCRFLATTSKPFLKYCLNNAIIPLVFLVVYLVKAYQYETTNELISLNDFIWNAFGFIAGFVLLLLISFAYFFTTDKRIHRSFKPGFIDFEENLLKSPDEERERRFALPVRYYFNSFFTLKKPRPVGHYSRIFLDDIFKRHHFSAILTMLMAFIFMVVVAFFLDHRIFQVPAAASISITFALIVAVLGALSYFLRSWSFLFIVVLYLFLNTLYHYNIIDPRNKAYGLNYSNKERPRYSLNDLNQLNRPEKIDADKANMIGVLNRWKAKQTEEKPVMILFNFSGGGLRGASFSMNVLQQLDSLTNGELMRRTFLMSGASGGILAASYYRELYRLHSTDISINPNDKKYLEDISGDLLNPVFSSLVARDLISPGQHFSYGPHSYIKDRGYAFENKLDQNTRGLLNHPVGFYRDAEYNAEIPLLILNSVVTRDFKKLMISTQPLAFMMQSEYIDSSYSASGPDAIDFAAMFRNEDPMNLRMLTALRMNATYPYILPAVWLPSDPVIDVMDAGLRDNNGQETSLRFLHSFKDWINENTSGIVLIQIRSREKGNWNDNDKNGGIMELVTKPFTMMQTNLFQMQDYSQDQEIDYAQEGFVHKINRVSFVYIPEKEEKGATLNFHLTTNEKIEVQNSLKRPNNRNAFMQIERLLNIQGRVSEK